MFLIGDIVLNPLTQKRCKVVHASSRGVYLREVNQPEHDPEYSFIPYVADPLILATVEDITFITE